MEFTMPTECGTEENASPTLGLQNVAGIFMLLIIGSTISGAILIFEVLFYKRVREV